MLSHHHSLTAMMFSKATLILAAASFATLVQGVAVRWGDCKGASHIKCPYVDNYTLQLSTYDEYSYLACRFVHFCI